ncbi:hypothetical protein [Acinetobacter sp.]|uniref:hypothetical protein n=1 Tax=Acinetobacter sp. TaxID=472 RepID=UPI003D058C8D
MPEYTLWSRFKAGLKIDRPADSPTFNQIWSGLPSGIQPEYEKGLLSPRICDRQY